MHAKSERFGFERIKSMKDGGKRQVGRAFADSSVRQGTLGICRHGLKHRVANSSGSVIVAAVVESD